MNLALFCIGSGIYALCCALVAAGTAHRRPPKDISRPLDLYIQLLLVVFAPITLIVIEIDIRAGSPER